MNSSLVITRRSARSIIMWHSSTRISPASFSTHLFDQGYRIFLHFKSGTVTEVGRGENPALPVRIIRENMNLEAPLLAGLLGKLTE